MPKIECPTYRIQCGGDCDKYRMQFKPIGGNFYDMKLAFTVYNCHKFLMVEIK